MWLKILTALAVTVAGGFVGRWAAQKYRRREQMLSDILRVCDSLRGDISFSQSKLSDTLEKYLTNVGADGKLLIESYLILLKEGAFIETDLLKARLCRGLLKDEEFSKVVLLFESLGKSDAETQTETIEGIKHSLEPYQKAAFDQKQKYASLYTKLGVLVGLGLGILLL